MDDAALAMLQAAMKQLIKIGLVVEVDASKGRARVQFEGLKSAWLRWGVARAGNDITWWAPEVGEQVLVLFAFGDETQGVIAQSLYSNAFAAPENSLEKRTMQFKDGAIIEYDREAHHLKAILPAGATTELVSDGGVTIVGDIAVTGKVTVSEDVVASGISLVNHTHGGIVRGGAETDAPS